jgi:phosphomevalonate kinase
MIEATLEAPGKMFLAGEYAVLEPGRAALVVAVDRALRLRMRPDPQPTVELWHKPSLVALIGELTGDSLSPVKWLGGVPGELSFAARATELGLRLCAEEKLVPRGYHAAFENDFAGGFDAASISDPNQQPPKLGLGGSAAATVLAIRAACLAQGRSISPQETFALAAASHWVEQGGRGSGGDVAASSLGGALEIKVRRAPANPEAVWSQRATDLLADPLVEATPIALPDDLRLLAVWSGQPADTREMMREIRALAAAKPSVYKTRLDRISFVTKALQAALGAAARDPGAAPRAEILSWVRHGATAMASLGEDALTFVVTPELAKICAVAAANKCAGKPSGAGGGDCAVVFAFGSEARSRVEAAMRELGFASARIEVAAKIEP